MKVRSRVQSGFQATRRFSLTPTGYMTTPSREVFPAVMTYLPLEVYRRSFPILVGSTVSASQNRHDGAPYELSLSAAFRPQ
jgi:hypothetical protein